MFSFSLHLLAKRGFAIHDLIANLSISVVHPVVHIMPVSFNIKHSTAAKTDLMLDADSYLSQVFETQLRGTAILDAFKASP